jgi:hypothetical protein
VKPHDYEPDYGASGQCGAMALVPDEQGGHGDQCGRRQDDLVHRVAALASVLREEVKRKTIPADPFGGAIRAGATEYDLADVALAWMEGRLCEARAPRGYITEQDVLEEAGFARPLPIHRTEAGYPRCSTCDGGGCPDCTDPA